MMTPASRLLPGTAVPSVAQGAGYPGAAGRVSAHGQLPEIEQRCTDARARLRRLPDPAGARPSSRGRGRPRGGLPAHRHRGRLRQRARGRRGHPPRPGIDRAEVFIETKIWISDYGYDADPARLRQERRQARRRPDRPAHPASGRCPAGSTGPSTPTGRSRSCWPTAGCGRSASATSCPSTSTSCWQTTTVVPAVNQIEVHPYFPSPRCGRGRRARHPHPGLVADRRHHLLPARARSGSTLEDPTIADDRRRRTARPRRR